MNTYSNHEEITTAVIADRYYLLDIVDDEGVSVTLNLCRHCARQLRENIDGPCISPPITVEDDYRCDGCNRPIIMPYNN